MNNIDHPFLGSKKNYFLKDLDTLSGKRILEEISRSAELSDNRGRQDVWSVDLFVHRLVILPYLSDKGW